MVAKWIKDTCRGNNYQLISFVDFAPTMLDAANIQREFQFEGISFFKKDHRQYIYAATDRFDEEIDLRRSIRGNNYKLIYNGDITTPIYKPIIYRSQMKTMQVLDSLHKQNKLNLYFSNWMSNNTKDSFELYKVSKDYYETNNLINNPKYDWVYKELKAQLYMWMDKSDFGNMNESMMLDSMFTSSSIIPKLNTPKVINNNSGYLINCNNAYTSIGWRNKSEKAWNIYKENELIKPKEDFEILLFRPGYEILIHEFNK